VEEVREFRPFASCLSQLGDWLAAEAATRVAVDATGVHWRVVWPVLERLERVELLLVNAHHVKTLPGRKADVPDACWLAQLLEYELLRGSCVPPCEVARLRDLTRYQEELVHERAQEARRLRQLLDGAGVERDTNLARVTTRPARLVPRAQMATEHVLEGWFDEHDAFMLGAHLAHIDLLTAAIERLDEEVLRLTHPFAGQFAR
jgi:transposase